ncbi:EBDP2, emopamil-binding protein [Calycina marina]|uniref:EBDP2, emopamil-binding protein n=1 Tax=Calycina marina TaxID=1763456 RepID=A0A9P8CFD9_9HELO|nr:EBDP2, emopamil-binding protein [Calycina marina]
MKTLNSTTSYITEHLYYPLEVPIHEYIVNKWSVPFLLAIFFGGCAIIMAATVMFVDRAHNHLPATEKAAIWWLVISGTIHLFFEGKFLTDSKGYFSLNHFQMGPAQDLFGQLWKEYAFSDSRYLTSDPFVLCMETVTAFTWGPLCFVVAYMVTNNHALRHPLQIIVTVGQIYGLILYYATSMFDHYYKEVTYSRPEFLYFWFYYFFMNFIWMVFPGILLVSSVRKIANAFNTLDKINGKKYTNGSAKKQL